MCLARMISTDEEALICDFAETYHILNYRSLPARFAAVLACGLRQDSRIMLKLNGMKVPFNTLLLAAIADGERVRIWQNTKDAVKGRNKPNLILPELTNEQKPKEEFRKFRTPEEFKEWEASMMKG